MKSVRFFLLLILMCLLATKSSKAATVIDHRSVEKFDSIPDEYIRRASEIKTLIRNASIGNQIGSPDTSAWISGLEGLRRTDPKYVRTNWIFSSRGNPSWQNKFSDLLTQAQLPQHMDKQYFMTKLCFIEQDKTADPQVYINQMGVIENYFRANGYTDKKVIYWTMPLTPRGDVARENFNRVVRNHVNQNNKILFDFADLESHYPDGTASRDSVGETLIRAYESGDGGHLSAAGTNRMAKAYWVMMATLAGWNGSGAEVTAVPTQQGNTCSQKYRGDANCNGVIGLDDFVGWKREYLGQTMTLNADFNNNGKVALDDFVVWKRGYLNI